MSATVTDAVLEADGDVLVVRWSLLGDEGGGHAGSPTTDRVPDPGVDIGVGPTPDGIDHVHTLTVAPGLRRARLEGLGTGRHYVSVAPHGGGGAVVVGERRVPFGGVTNFRDLGGYPAADGGRTRWGRVFRSDALHRFTPVDLERYGSLHLNAVYDLRGDIERERYPNPFPSVQLALLSRDGSEPATPPDTADWQEAAAGERMLRQMYQGLLANGAAVFGRLLGALAAPGGLPAVFHCTGGKDRTGMSAALLLDLLGVPRHLVLDDYQLHLASASDSISPSLTRASWRPGWVPRQPVPCWGRPGGRWPTAWKNLITPTAGPGPTCSGRPGCLRQQLTAFGRCSWSEAGGRRLR
jgi:protein-tyrosine phosphatase